MKNIYLLLLVALINANAMSPDAQEGKELYHDADCQKCHQQGSIFDKKDAKANNLFELKGWVTSCAGFFDVGWFPEEEKQVLLYLNESVYKFKNK